MAYSLSTEFRMTANRNIRHPNSAQIGASWSATNLSLLSISVWMGCRITRGAREKMSLAKREGLHLIFFMPKDLKNLRAAFSAKVLAMFEGGGTK